MIRKYASLESAQVLDLKGSKDRSRTASLDKIAEFEDYRTEDGYLYARIRAISSRVNKNHDGWPSVELAGGKEVFDKYASLARSAGFTVTASEETVPYGFSTFLGKPVFVDHNNSNPDRARGVIVDAKLHVEDHRTSAHDPYYSSDSVDSEHLPPTWVELLLEVDAKSFPKLAKAIIEGAKDSKKGIDGFSMGCDVEKSVCNICKNAATSPDDFCNHVKLKGAHFDYINPKTGRKESKRSYENCYGVKFFEISAVFDPADETALIREVKASVEKEAGPVCRQCGGTGHLTSGNSCPLCEGTGKEVGPLGAQNEMLNTWNQIKGLPETTHPLGYTTGSWNERLTMRKEAPGNEHMKGVSPKRNRQYEHIKEQLMESGKDEEEAKEEAARTVNKQRAEKGETKSHLHVADAPLPQADLMTVPEYVDTMREEEVCPVCGSNMEEGHQCEVCGYVAPPEGLDNPDLDQAQTLNQPSDQPQMDTPKDLGQPGTTEVGSPNPTPPRNLAPISSVNDGWQIHHPKLAGKINPVERPIRPDTKPGTNEPNETILSDQDKPVTQRTAASMIAAANKENNMGNAHTAADAPTADTRADKRVDVTDVGGVLSPSNEEASKPEGPHSWENKGTTTDVTGKGGVLEDSNQEASTPSQGTQSLPTAGQDSDDAGYNKEKNIPQQRTQTFPNTNEPNSAVTDKAFPTSSWKIVGYDDGPYPKEQEDLTGGGAKKGTDPADPVGKADERVDLTEHVTSPENNSGPTKTWNGTNGNGVTRQQDPVTRETLEGSDIVNLKRSFVEILKIADTEVELGLITPEEKYDRLAELEQATDEEIAGTAKTLAKVKTAGLKKNASTQQNGVGRVPSFRTPREASVSDADEALFM